MTNPKKYTQYDRFWRIVVTPKKSQNSIVLSSSDFGEQALHCKFQLDQQYGYPWYGDIVVFNLSPTMISFLKKDLKENKDVGVLVEAGYKNGVHGVVWQGRVWQYLFVRENLVDSILTLHCVHDYHLTVDNHINETTPDGMTQKQIFEYVANKAGLKVDHVDSTLDNSTPMRPVVLNGSPFEILDEIAKFNNQKVVIQANGSVAASNIRLSSLSTEIVITPQSGLIGIPTQTNQGVSFRCLMDSRLKYTNPPQNIKIEGYVREMKWQFGENAPIAELVEEGRYKLISVTHIGDTRGSEWYSDCQGWVTADMILNLPFKGIPSIGEQTPVVGQ